MKEKKKTSKLASYLTTALLIVAICLCLFVFVQVVNRGYVSFFGYSFFRVSTGSMEPTLPVGTLIMTEETDIGDVEIDDIVSFYSKETYMQGRIITHRVVAKDVGSDGRVYLTTRGDANSAADVHFVDSENLIGRLKWSSEDGNVFADILAFVSSSFGFFSCIALPAIVIAIFIFKRCIYTMMTEMKKLKEEMQGLSEEIAEGEREDGKETEYSEDIKEEPTPTAAAQSDASLEEYEEMYERIRADLLEELKQSNDRGQQKTE